MPAQDSQVKVNSQTETVDYTAIVNSTSFKHLLAEKKKFILPFSLFFLAFYFTLPLLTAFSTVLNQPAIGSITWAWMFAFAQFIMTWVLCILYSKKSAKFDVLVENILQQIEKGR